MQTVDLEVGGAVSRSNGRRAQSRFQPGDEIIRWPALRQLLGGEDAPDPATVWRWEAKNLWPKRISLGPGSVGWIRREVNDALAKRAGAAA